MLTSSNLKDCENYIYKQLGIKIQLKIKPMDGGFDFEPVKLYEDKKIK